MVTVAGRAPGRWNLRFRFLIPSFSFLLPLAPCSFGKVSQPVPCVSFRKREIRAKRDVRAGRTTTDSLRAQHNHRLDATSSARRDPAGEKRDAAQEQSDTREGNRIGSAHAVEQALHHTRATEGNEQPA